MQRRVAIAGGGLAGLTCAKYLTDAGYAVEIYEGMPFLGGRASTFRDEDGDWVEQGLHLFLGVYSEFQQLLREIGQPPSQVLHWMNQIRFQDPEGPSATFGINPIYSPFKTILGFLGQNDYLSPMDKLSMLPLVLPSISDMDRLQRLHDDESVTQWWQRMNGREDVLERFLRPFCRAIQFSEPEDFSAYNFLGWVHHILYNVPGSLAGGYKGARDEIIFQPLARLLQERGALIRTRAKLKEILYDTDNSLVQGFILEDGTRVEADAYVVAVPAWAFAPLVPGPLRENPFFMSIGELPVAPAISVQLWFDRQVIRHSNYTLVARTVTPVYQDQTQYTYPNPRGSRISVIVSPADDLLDKSDQGLVARVLKSLGSVEPDIWKALVTKSKVLRHKQHLIRPLPGAMSRRPVQRTPVPNLFLAGDWTQQPFFGSQEGAVRGGKAAARAIVEALPPNMSVVWLDEAYTPQEALGRPFMQPGGP